MIHEDIDCKIIIILEIHHPFFFLIQILSIYVTCLLYANDERKREGSSD